MKLEKRKRADAGIKGMVASAALTLSILLVLSLVLLIPTTAAAAVLGGWGPGLGEYLASGTCVVGARAPATAWYFAVPSKG